MPNDQIKTQLEILAAKLHLTTFSISDEKEEYILTPQEEVKAIAHAIEMEKENLQFRLLNLGDSLEKISVKIAEIDWDLVINRDEILKLANSNKQYNLWILNKREEEKNEKIKKLQELKELHTAKFFYNLMAWTSKNVFSTDLIVNDQNRRLIATICFFLSGDERFESELGYSFKKGLYIRGMAGLGKTYLFRCVKDNELLPVQIFSMIEIAEIVKEQGYLNLPIPERGLLYLDDVGSEEAVVNHYGTKINFFKNFIEKYYLNHTGEFNKLVISTNNNFAEIEEKYGFRVKSRIKDMFNIVDVVGNDMRGQQANT